MAVSVAPNGDSPSRLRSLSRYGFVLAVVAAAAVFVATLLRGRPQRALADDFIGAVRAGDWSKAASLSAGTARTAVESCRATGGCADPVLAKLRASHSVQTSWWVALAWGARCVEATPSTREGDDHVYLALEELQEGWRVTEVTTIAGDTLCDSKP